MIPGVQVPCLDCGLLSPYGARCSEHARANQRASARESYARNGRRQRREGHSDTQWRRLSERARAMQPFCSVCGVRAEQAANEGDRLEADHLPVAWFKRERGQRLTLGDVQVVCGEHNRALGSSRPGSPRYEEWAREQAIA